MYVYMRKWNNKYTHPFLLLLDKDLLALTNFVTGDILPLVVTAVAYWCWMNDVVAELEE